MMIQTKFLVGEVILSIFLEPLEGFLMCDGSFVKHETYPRLFQALGNWYGRGGDTYFRVPELAAPDGMTYQIKADGGLYGAATFRDCGGCLSDIRFLADDERPTPECPLANGATLSVRDYSRLYNELLDRFGGTDNTFNLPAVPSLQPENGPPIPAYIVAQGVSVPSDTNGKIPDDYIGLIRPQAAQGSSRRGYMICDGTPYDKRLNHYLSYIIGTRFGADIPVLPPTGDCDQKILALGLYATEPDYIKFGLR